MKLDGGWCVCPSAEECKGVEPKGADPVEEMAFEIRRLRVLAESLESEVAKLTAENARLHAEIERLTSLVSKWAWP